MNLRPRSGDRAVAAEGSEHTGSRPTIGLALGGGAARGFAHTGIIQTLLAHDVKPDVITGTSMGAVGGGCHAAGHLDAFMEWSRTLTRRRVLRYLDVSLSGAGLIKGTRLARHLESTLGGTKIETLAIRFAAIATEIGTGHEVILRGKAAARALPPTSLGFGYAV
jgi:NTE family protein